MMLTHSPEGPALHRNGGEGLALSRGLASVVLGRGLAACMLMYTYYGRAIGYIPTPAVRIL